MWTNTLALPVPNKNQEAHNDMQAEAEPSPDGYGFTTMANYLTHRTTLL